MLHVMVRSPFDCASFAACLRVIAPGDCLVLSGDAVYAAIRRTVPGSRLAGAVARSGIRVHALDADLSARGLGDAVLIAEVERIDDGAFVDLTAGHPPVHTWL